MLIICDQTKYKHKSLELYTLWIIGCVKVKHANKIGEIANRLSGGNWPSQRSFIPCQQLPLLIGSCGIHLSLVTDSTHSGAWQAFNLKHFRRSVPVWQLLRKQGKDLSVDTYELRARSKFLISTFDLKRITGPNPFSHFLPHSLTISHALKSKVAFTTSRKNERFNNKSVLFTSWKLEASEQITGNSKNCQV